MSIKAKESTSKAVVTLMTREYRLKLLRCQMETRNSKKEPRSNLGFRITFVAVKLHSFIYLICVTSYFGDNKTYAKRNSRRRAILQLKAHILSK